MTIKEELAELVKKENLTSNEIAHIAMTEYYIVLVNQFRTLFTKANKHEKKGVANCIKVHVANYKRWVSQYNGTQATDVHIQDTEIVIK